jgi:Ser/Thr protein kinase RdoA (MazF antagonist)
MIRAETLPFIPHVLCGADGSTVSLLDGSVWDCCRWMPGEPLARPTAPEVATACEAVARLHAVWAAGTEPGPCPGVTNRVRILSENETLLRAGSSTLPPVSPHLDPLLRRAVDAVSSRALRAVRALEPWTRWVLALHPCLRDLRAEHVLFLSDKVSGVIDFGAAAVDHAAVDLARLLGDYAPADDELFAVGVRAYRAARPAFDVPDEFVRVLAATGAVCSLLGWIVRLVVNRELLSGLAALRARLTVLLERVEANSRF